MSLLGSVGCCKWHWQRRCASSLPAIPAHMPLALRCPPRHPQVFELQAGVDSGEMWREAALLRQCEHPRIVPILGIALKAGEGRRAEGLACTTRQLRQRVSRNARC